MTSFCSSSLSGSSHGAFSVFQGTGHSLACSLSRSLSLHVPPSSSLPPPDLLKHAKKEKVFSPVRQSSHFHPYPSLFFPAVGSTEGQENNRNDIASKREFPHDDLFLPSGRQWMLHGPSLQYCSSNDRGSDVDVPWPETHDKTFSANHIEVDHTDRTTFQKGESAEKHHQDKESRNHTREQTSEKTSSPSDFRQRRSFPDRTPGLCPPSVHGSFIPPTASPITWVEQKEGGVDQQVSFPRQDTHEQEELQQIMICDRSGSPASERCDDPSFRRPSNPQAKHFHFLLLANVGF
mmetsp:Transcript_8773/g.23704  ORF Transcript_8773/g.23704 Transcript_8773/m.23704 type:complete len:292 (-) Transcript_8773:609-1484(-)|eukprot:CAMPEP_0113878780 /NCGR_PEP_ID=MMETSP0780_2-20120614/6874_1 /TAXON_ID=652834 /ORGANISM="Palpitomonas bilix" /LENGTH=291 /DNA_ID=CAMNT_0000865291 /DNA_START=194 /DNA_END=1069 /DNA_ORIENTATION=- /assembly_acc=CAM_ASM_000599